MKFKVYFDQAYDCIRIEIHGEFSSSNLPSITAEVTKLYEKHGTKSIINDMRDVVLTEGSFDIYKMPEKIRNSGIVSGIKRALVVPEVNEQFQFFENVFVNQGHRVKIFTDISAAEQWAREAD
jgi:hypothetical protein